MIPFFKKPSSSKDETHAALLDHDFSRLNYTVIDCEMTGLNTKQDHLLSIGAVKIIDGQVRLEDSFYKVIRQEPKSLKLGTMPIHRLGHQKVAEGEAQDRVIAQLETFCKGSVTVGHFFQIDLDFLNPQLTNPFDLPSLDTRKIAHWLLKKQNPHIDHQAQLQLEKICETWQIPRFPAHHALGDALRTACLFLAMQKKINQVGIYNFSELLKIAKV